MENRGKCSDKISWSRLKGQGRPVIKKVFPTIRWGCYRSCRQSPCRRIQPSRKAWSRGLKNRFLSGEKNVPNHQCNKWNKQAWYFSGIIAKAYRELWIFIDKKGLKWSKDNIVRISVWKVWKSGFNRLVSELQKCCLICQWDGGMRVISNSIRIKLFRLARRPERWWRGRRWTSTSTCTLFKCRSPIKKSVATSSLTRSFATELATEQLQIWTWITQRF